MSLIQLNTRLKLSFLLLGSPLTGLYISIKLVRDFLLFRQIFHLRSLDIMLNIASSLLEGISQSSGIFTKLSKLVLLEPIPVYFEGKSFIFIDFMVNENVVFLI